MTIAPRPIRLEFDRLPLFATDAELGPAILGQKRAGEWAGIAGYLEGKGLPQIDPLFGARYRPAVKKFFDTLWNIDAPGVMPAADGHDRMELWKTALPPTSRRRRV
jgi:hypothetical protein